jgi:hypothetical protein
MVTLTEPFGVSTRTRPPKTASTKETRTESVVLVTVEDG